MADRQNTNRMTGRSAFLALLKQEGVRRIFGNPGTTELPIMHALGAEPELHYVLGLQESVVVAMADGYARASGELVACNLHVAPGLGNAIGVLYTALISGTPMIVTAGQQEQGHGLTEPLLYAPLVPIASPVVKWASEVNRLDDLPRLLHRAATVALTPPTGPVFLSLPGDILNGEAALELGAPTRIDSATRPSDGALERLAERLLAARRPVILAGHELATADALNEAAEFAELLGAPVYQQTVAQGAHFPSLHPCYVGAPGRDQRKVRALLEPHDLLIVLGADVLKMSVWSATDPLPAGLPIVQLGLRDWEIGKNYPVEQALHADPKETLRVLNPLLAARGGAGLAERARLSREVLAERNWSAERARRGAEARARRARRPLDPDWLMLRLSELLPDDAIVVDEGITTSANLPAFLPYRDRHGFFGNASGGIGWGIAAAVGVQLAQPARRVVAVLGDGSAMYAIQALWTAAAHRLPMVFVLANNGGYRILRQRLKLFHGSTRAIGMSLSDPPIDNAGLARAFGLEAHRVEDADGFEARFTAALHAPGPTLLEVMVEGGL
jgi:benzoylformate decarboxylase